MSRGEAVAATTEVKVPDIGDFPDVAIIEVHVHAGDAVNEGDPLITLESDKATMDIPAPGGGLIKDVLVKLGDRVSEGTPIVVLEPGDGALHPPPSLVDQQEPQPVEAAPSASNGGAPAPTPAVDGTQACAGSPGSSGST
jgi:pyruvate dehydrogenase E2 component (dihydrolipoamide acetyltransferase)